MATFQLTETGAFTPITVEDAKLYLKYSESVSALDGAIEVLLLSAKQYVERYTSRLIGEYEVVEYWDGWPRDGVFKLKFGVSVSIGSVEIFDGTDWIEVEVEDYSVDPISLPARVKMLSIGNYSLGTGLNVIRITYNCGTSDGSDLPSVLTTLQYMLLSFWLENGTDQDVSDLNYINKVLNLYVINR